jgi:hypothetical protein
MSERELEEVLSNWIRQAISSEGELLPKGIEPAKWIAKQFLAWWREQAVASAVGDAELATARVREELTQAGGFDNPQLGEAMHELIHLSDALAEIRGWLGFDSDDLAGTDQ